MGWLFWKKPPHPLDAAGLRPLEARILSGDLRAAAPEVKRAREQHGDVPAVRYLECLLYHEGQGADPGELASHLRPAVASADGPRFPEANLLEARLCGAAGRFDAAAACLNALGRDKLKPEMASAVRTLAAEVERVRGADAVRAIAAEAEAFAADLARVNLVVRWRASDLARIDSLLDDMPDLAAAERARFVTLAGEVAVRAARGSWRLALRPDDRAVVLGGKEWSPARALAERLAKGAPLYAALHRALATPTHPVPGVAGVELAVEPGVHPAVVADHAARALLGAGVSALGVFRERPTPEGPIVLPLSFVDKGGVLRALYVETRPWEPERVGELRRFAARLRQSAAREAQLGLLAAHDPPPVVLDLLAGREGPSPILAAETHEAGAGRGFATPRSLDEPKLRWLDEKAEMMERLVRSSLGNAQPSDLELVKKVQQTVLASLAGDPAEFTPKQWNALYGYGALYGRILARSFGGRWSALSDDKPPGEWEMLLPWGRVIWPIGRLLKLAHLGTGEGDLVVHYLEAKSAADRT